MIQAKTALSVMRLTKLYDASQRTFMQLLLLSCSVAACTATRPVSPTFPVAKEPEFSKVLQQLAATPAQPAPAIAVFVAQAPTRLVGWDIKAKRKLWDVPVFLKSAPVLAGNYVVAEEEDGIVIRDLRKGAIQSTLDSGRLFGAGSYGNKVAVSVGEVGGTEGAIIVTEKDQVLWRGEFTGLAGEPAVFGNVIIAPWGNQQLSVLDATSGQERARLTINDSVLGHAFTYGKSAYVGQIGLFRLTRAMEKGRKKQADYFEFKARILPTQPQLFAPGYQPVPPPEHASYRARMVWIPTASDQPLGLQDNGLYFVFYRFVFALDPQESAIRWAYVHPTDIAGAVAEPHGVRIVGQDGAMAFLSAKNGYKASNANVGMRVIMAALPSLEGVPSAENKEITEPELAEQLLSVGRTDDPRLAAGRTFALGHLSALNKAEVTAALIELCEDARAPQPVRSEACKQLGQRTNGQKEVLAALERRASFLEKKSEPAVGALADAAVTMKLNQAAPLLLRHLQDPNTPADELPRVAHALRELGDRSHAPALSAFIAMYHSTNTEPSVSDSVIAAMESMRALDPKAAETTLQAVQDGPFTLPLIRARATSLLVAPLESKDKPATGAISDKSAPTKPQATVTEEKPTQTPTPKVAAEDTRPVDLSSEMIAQTFSKSREKFEACFDGAAPTVQSANLGLVILQDGSVASVFVYPAALKACMTPLVNGLTFPATRGAERKQIRYELRRIASAATAAVKEPETKQASKEPDANADSKVGANKEALKLPKAKTPLSKDAAAPAKPPAPAKPATPGKPEATSGKTATSTKAAAATSAPH